MNSLQIHSILHRESPWVYLTTGFVTVSFGVMLIADKSGEITWWAVGAAACLLLASTCLAIKMALGLKDDSVYPGYRAFELGIPIVTFWILIGHGLAYQFADFKVDVPPQNTFTWVLMLLLFVLPFIAICSSPAVDRCIQRWTKTVGGTCIFGVLLLFVLFFVSYINVWVDLHMTRVDDIEEKVRVLGDEPSEKGREFGITNIPD